MLPSVHDRTLPATITHTHTHTHTHVPTHAWLQNVTMGMVGEQEKRILGQQVQLVWHVHCPRRLQLLLMLAPSPCVLG